MAHSKEQNKLTKTIPPKVQTSDLLDKDCKITALNIFKEVRNKEKSKG